MWYKKQEWKIWNRYVYENVKRLQFIPILPLLYHTPNDYDLFGPINLLLRGIHFCADMEVQCVV